MELNRERWAWVRSQVKHPENLILADSLRIGKYAFPTIDFSISSPPYMPRYHRYNPLSFGKRTRAGYARYLREIQSVYKQVGSLMKRNGTVVVEVSNLKEKVVTPLAWDICAAVSKVLRFDGEIVVCFTDNQNPKEFDRSYCLLFRK